MTKSEKSRKTGLETGRSSSGPTLGDALAKALGLGLSDRAKFLAGSEHGPSLVPKLPPDEFLFTVRASDDEDAVTLLSFAGPTQVAFLLDMEIWKGEEIAPSRARRWLEALSEMEDGKLERLLRRLPEDCLAALFGKVASGSLADEEGLPEKDDGEGVRSFTPDGVHYFTAPLKTAQVLERTMKLLRNSGGRSYAALAEILLTGFDAEDEETANHLRRARLAENGFLEPEDAMKIYGRLDPANFTLAEKRRKESGYAARPVSSTLPALQLKNEGLLRKLLDRAAGGPDGESLREQLANLTKLVLAADRMDYGKAESFAGAAGKVSAMLTIGLETLFGADESAMEKALADHWLQDIFRVGATTTRKASEAARAFLGKGWPKGDREKLKILGHTWEETILSLLGPRPAYFEEDDQGGSKRAFASLNEIRLAEAVVSGASALDRLFRDGMGIPLADLPSGPGEPEAASYFLTALANATLGKNNPGEKLTPGEARRFLSLILEGEAPARTARREFTREALAWARKTADTDKTGETGITMFADAAFQALEDELGALPPEAAPDPRIVTVLLMEGRGKD